MTGKEKKLKGKIKSFMEKRKDHEKELLREQGREIESGREK